MSGPAAGQDAARSFSEKHDVEESVAEETLAAPGTQHAKSLGRSLAGGTAWQTLAQVVPLVINLGFTPYFIVGLGTDRYSIFLLVNNVILLLSQFDGGLGQSAMRFFTLYAGRGDRVSATRLLVSVSLILTAVTVVVFGGVFLGARSLLDFFRVEPGYVPESLLLVRVLVVLLAFMMVRNLYNSLLFAHHRFRITSIAIVSGYLVYLCGMLATIRYGWGLTGVAATFVAQQILGTLITVPAGLGYIDRKGLRWMRRDEARSLFGYAWRVQITGLITMATSQKDQLVAGRMLTAQASGPYGQGANFAQNLRMLPLNAFGPLQAAIGQAVGSRGAAGARSTAERVQRVWVRGLAGYGAVGIPATYAGVGTWLRDSFGHTAAVVATLLFAASLAVLWPAVLTLWCLSLGEAGLNLRASVVGLIANVLLSVAGWFAFGMTGVVAATVLAQFTAALWLSWEASRKLDTPLEWWGRAVPWGWALLAAAVTAALEFLVAGHLPRGALGLLGCGLLAAPGFVAYLLLVFGRDGLRQVTSRLPRGHRRRSPA